MATIIQAKGEGYVSIFSKPESEWIQSLAECMGITKEAVIGAAINKGLTYYVESFRTEKTVDKIKDLMDDETDDLC